MFMDEMTIVCTSYCDDLVKKNNVSKSVVTISPVDETY